MSVNVDVLRRLAALRLAPDAMSEVLSIIADMQSEDDDRKSRDRNRKRNVRGKSVENPGTVRGMSEDTLSPKEIPPTPPKEITPILPNKLKKLAREAFPEFRKIYPKRNGSQPWTPAETKFVAICAGGVDPIEILDGCRRFADAEAVGGDPDYVPQAITWLNQQRWKDDHQPRQSRAGPQSIPLQNNRNVYVGIEDTKRILRERYAKREQDERDSRGSGKILQIVPPRPEGIPGGNRDGGGICRPPESLFPVDD